MYDYTKRYPNITPAMGNLWFAMYLIAKHLGVNDHARFDLAYHDIRDQAHAMGFERFRRLPRSTVQKMVKDALKLSRHRRLGLLGTLLMGAILCLMVVVGWNAISGMTALDAVDAVTGNAGSKLSQVIEQRNLLLNQ